MEITENYVYKKEVDWSLLQEGLTLPIDIQMVFRRNMGRFIQRGETKSITLYLEGKAYQAKIRNLDFDANKYKRKDILQIRYTKNGHLAQQLQQEFNKSYEYLLQQRNIRGSEDRSMIRLPVEYKEYIAIYTTEYEDSYILETILSDDIKELKYRLNGKQERVAEASFNYDVNDEASLIETERTIKIRKLNKKIGDNLKLLYSYRCQICGKMIGEDYGSNIVEAHHIDYFVNSLNNDANNQMIVCPNHHTIIHNVNPVFYRKRLLYIYPNGYKEGLVLNQHL